jgi:hypothetical protein
MSQTPRPHHRTRVTRADDRYVLGQPPPAIRIEAGEVLSVESDSCTVLMFGETVAGVAFLADPPAVGDVIEVWEADDLLWTPGYADGSTGGSDAAHLVSRARPAAVDLPINIGGSFRDDSWFFEAVDQPTWQDAALEDLSGVEVTQAGTDNEGILWSPNAFDVRPGDALTFHLTATYLAGNAASAQVAVCYGDGDSDPLPGTDTAVAYNGSAMSIIGVDDELTTTWTVPATVVTADDPVLVPLRGRIGIRLHLFDAVTLYIGATAPTNNNQTSLALPPGTLPGDILVLAMHTGGFGGDPTCSDPRISHQTPASHNFVGWGFATSSTAPVTVNSVDGENNGGVILAAYRTDGTVTGIYSTGSSPLHPTRPPGGAGIMVAAYGANTRSPTQPGWVLDVARQGGGGATGRAESWSAPFGVPDLSWPVDAPWHTYVIAIT